MVYVRGLVFAGGMRNAMLEKFAKRQRPTQKLLVKRLIALSFLSIRIRRYFGTWIPKYIQVLVVL